MRSLSLISQPDFFLAPDGKSSPEHELKATLNAFFGPNATKLMPQKMPAQCVYAARFHWLVNELHIDPKRATFLPCTELHTFLDALGYTGASLVFSNYFADNPGSLFGHTFLRLQRTSQLQTDSAMLDDISNFAASVPNTTSLLYPIKGLAGGYKGRFSLVPYYVKIQEYNNAQSRDLWEYELNLTSQELRMLELELWEVGWTYIDYYYLDDNCSYIMLSLLEAAKPELHLTDKLWIYAIPSDTIRVVNRTPGLVKNSKYRASVLSRYTARLSLLNAPEKQKVNRLIAMNTTNPNQLTELFNGCGALCKTQVIDTTLEYIDFKEKLVGEKDPVTYADLRKNILVTRSQEPMPSQPIEQLPTASSSPTQGHDSGLVMLSGGADLNEGHPFVTLRWRPALHDIEADDVGYSDGLGIGFMDTGLRLEPQNNNAYLNYFHLLEITSLPPQIQNVNFMSWHFDSGYERGVGFGDAQNEGRIYTQVGIGSSYYALNNQFLLYGLLHLDVGYANNFFFHMGPTVTLGTMLRPASFLKLLGKIEYARRYHVLDSSYVDSLKASATLAHYISQNIETRLVYANNEHVSEVSFGVQYYF